MQNIINTQAKTFPKNPYDSSVATSISSLIKVMISRGSLFGAVGDSLALFLPFLLPTWYKHHPISHKNTVIGKNIALSIRFRIFILCPVVVSVSINGRVVKELKRFQK
jgi:hypothetical protein